jgi:hypothetical protein
LQNEQQLQILNIKRRFPYTFLPSTLFVLALDPSPTPETEVNGDRCVDQKKGHQRPFENLMDVQGGLHVHPPAHSQFAAQGETGQYV